MEKLLKKCGFEFYENPLSDFDGKWILQQDDVVIDITLDIKRGMFYVGISDIDDMGNGYGYGPYFHDEETNPMSFMWHIDDLRRNGWKEKPLVTFEYGE